MFGGGEFVVNPLDDTSSEDSIKSGAMSISQDRQLSSGHIRVRMT